jgi:hypothetical protein
MGSSLRAFHSDTVVAIPLALAHPAQYRVTRDADNLPTLRFESRSSECGAGIECAMCALCIACYRTSVSVRVALGKLILPTSALQSSDYLLRSSPATLSGNPLQRPSSTTLFNDPLQRPSSTTLFNDPLQRPSSTALSSETFRRYLPAALSYETSRRGDTPQRPCATAASSSLPLPRPSPASEPRNNTTSLTDLAITPNHKLKVTTTETRPAAVYAAERLHRPSRAQPQRARTCDRKPWLTCTLRSRNGPQCKYVRGNQKELFKDDIAALPYANRIR